jgi:hypothetical protein
MGQTAYAFTAMFLVCNVIVKSMFPAGRFARCSGVQVFRCSGVQVFRCSGVQVGSTPLRTGQFHRSTMLAQAGHLVRVVGLVPLGGALISQQVFR